MYVIGQTVLSIYFSGVVFLIKLTRNATDTHEKENEYKNGSVTFIIQREYSGDKKLGDIIGDMVLKKVVTYQ